MLKASRSTLKVTFDGINVKQDTPQVVAWLVPLKVTNVSVTMQITDRVEPTKISLESSAVRDRIDVVEWGVAAAPQLSRQGAD